mgnify:CR=1 FL=1
MNILNKIMIVICLPIFIFAEVQRAPGQPLARPKKHKMEQKGSGQNTSQYVLTVKKSNAKSPEYNINIRPIGSAQDAGVIAQELSRNLSADSYVNHENLSTHESEESVERIAYGDWRD